MFTAEPIETAHSRHGRVAEPERYRRPTSGARFALFAERRGAVLIGSTCAVQVGDMRALRRLHLMSPNISSADAPP